MTLKELQRYLDREKWRDSERYGGDLCGRYVRCRYCDRDEPFPCAVAHNRLIEVISTPFSETSEWSFPQEIYGIKSNPVPVATMKRKRRDYSEPIGSYAEPSVREEMQQAQVRQTVIPAAESVVSAAGRDVQPAEQPIAQQPVREVQPQPVMPSVDVQSQKSELKKEPQKVLSARSGKEGARVRLFSVKKKNEETPED